MNKSGRTPLFRAKKLESILGIKKIYLKLEGSNPFGHKFDRIAEILVKDALAQKQEILLVDGPKKYIRIIEAYAEMENLAVKVPQFKGESWKSKSFAKEMIIDFKKKSIDEKMSIIADYCESNNIYNAANGYYNTHLSILALEEIGEELIEKLDDISSVFVQLSYGYTVSSLYNCFFRAWAKGELEAYPHIFSCTIPKGNRIYEDYKLRNEIPDIDVYDLKINKYTKDLYIENTQLLEESLKAIRDTDGEIVTINEDLLKEASNLLKKSEFIEVSAEEAYSFAGFYKKAKAGLLEDGNHIIVLNNGRSDIQIEQLEDFSDCPEEKIVQYARTFLAQYADPLHEMQDAVKNAMKQGAIFLAKMNGEVQGVTIVVNTNFDDFIPSYHLAYIGTRVGRKGRGIASALIDSVIEFTEGNVSLHVDLDNNRAKKLYEKFGFKHKYNRMIYVNPDSE